MSRRAPRRVINRPAMMFMTMRTMVMGRTAMPVSCGERCCSSWEEQAEPEDQAIIGEVDDNAGERND
ncbi:hypothetical protein FHX14_005529 [Rhizobium sp. BK619]|nr:hypothetical protein [Rhizobium sp. BK619]